MNYQQQVVHGLTEKDASDGITTKEFTRAAPKYVGDVADFIRIDECDDSSNFVAITTSWCPSA
jgi:hypothetical protein